MLLNISCFNRSVDFYRLIKDGMFYIYLDKRNLNCCITCRRYLLCLYLQIFYLYHRYSESLELEDAVHTAILTLKESFEGQMTEDNIEIGICNQDGFKRLTTAEVKDYLASVQWSPSKHWLIINYHPQFFILRFFFVEGLQVICEIW